MRGQEGRGARLGMLPRALVLVSRVADFRKDPKASQTPPILGWEAFQVVPAPST